MKVAPEVLLGEPFSLLSVSVSEGNSRIGWPGSPYALRVLSKEFSDVCCMPPGLMDALLMLGFRSGWRIPTILRFLPQTFTGVSISLKWEMSLPVLRLISFRVKL